MATGDHIAAFYRAVPPTSNLATQDFTAAPHPIFDFDDATTETMYFVGQVSGSYDGTSSIDVQLPWKFSTFVGSQTAAWDVSFYRIGDDTDSIESYTFATARSVTDTEASLTGEVSYASITFTNAQADGIQPGEEFVLKVSRNAGSGTASPGDAELTWPFVLQA